METIETHFWFCECQSPQTEPQTDFSKTTNTKLNPAPSAPLLHESFHKTPKINKPKRNKLFWIELLWILRWFFCVWLLLLLLMLQHHHIIIILIIPFVFILCQSKEASPARVREVKRNFQIPINLCKFCVVCLYSLEPHYTPRIYWMSVSVHTYYERYLPHEYHLSVCHSSACACAQNTYIHT